MFWIWNNGREVININHITYIQCLENDLHHFAEVSLVDGGDNIEISKEQYDSLMKLIMRNYKVEDK